MPEGDTIFKTATTLRKAILGKRITGFEARVDQITERYRPSFIVHRRIHAVEPRGKHLLVVMRPDPDDSEPITVPERLELELNRNDLVLHTHLRMTGSWHIYRHGEPWQKPRHYRKVVIETEGFVVPCFSAPVVELLTARETARHEQLVSLGPDAIIEEFDGADALQRLRARPDVEIGVAIMIQRIMAGVGNVYKSEVLFIKRVNPFSKVGDLNDDTLKRLISESHKLLRLNGDNGHRRTHFGLDERQRLWVYQRSGRPCRVCGTTIKVRRQGLDARVTFWCPNCQPIDAELCIDLPKA